MSEDQTRRLCECGKPANHESVCRQRGSTAGLDPERDVQRIDRAVEERMAREREERNAKRRLRFDAERRDRRARTDTLSLHREAMERAMTMSTVKAGSTERSRGGGDGPGGPGRQQLLTDDPRWEDATRIVRKRILQMLDLLDEAEGTGHAQAVAAMDGTEKDRVILDEGRGLIAEQVVAELGPEYGSASYIRKLRRARGLDNRGYPKEA